LNEERIHAEREFEELLLIVMIAQLEVEFYLIAEHAAVVRVGLNF
jgi:hypothetical protein